MIIDIFKNPVILGLIMGTLTFIYITWNNEKNAKNKEKIKKERKTTAIIAPLVVGAITWFLAYGYFGSTKQETTSSATVIEQPVVDTGFNIGIGGNQNLAGNGNIENILSSSDPTKSYTLIGKGLTVPHKLPEVFIETI